MRQRLVSWEELWSCYFAHRIAGRRRLGLYQQILLERDGNVPPGGEFARLVAELVVADGFPQPVFEYPVSVDGHDYLLDIAWPQPMITIECNGAGSHETPKGFRRDPAKRNRVEQAGWNYLEYTWWDFVRTPSEIRTQVRRSFEAATR